MRFLRNKFFLNALGSLIFKGVAGVTGFISSVLVARFLGSEQAGLYFLAFAILGFLTVIGKLGLDRTVLRIVSVGFSSAAWDSVKGIVVFGLNTVFVVSVVIAILVWVSADVLSVFVFNKPDLAPSLRFIGLTVPLISLSAIMAEALQGLHRFLQSVFILSISPGLWLCIFFAAIYVLDIPVKSQDACFALLLAYAITVLHGFYFLRDCIAPAVSAKSQDRRDVLTACLPLYITDIMAITVLLSAQLLAGHWLDSTELAHFAAAQRTASLTSLLLLALNLVAAPRFAALYHQGKHTELRRLAQLITLAVTAIAVPVVAMMCLVPSWIMSIFGSDFTEAGALLPILALGQLVNAMTGSVGYLLVMSGHQKDMRDITVISGIVAILLPLLLLPWLGAVGAAVSTALALSVQNIMALVRVRQKLGFWTLGFPGKSLPQG